MRNHALRSRSFDQTDREVGYGLPSGHAQHTLVEWGVIAAWVHRRWFSVLAVALVASIGFSRIWLGVHFPTDVLGGWLLGAVLLWIYLRYGERITTRLSVAGSGWQLGCALAVSLALVASYAATFPRTHRTWPDSLASGLALRSGSSCAHGCCRCRKAAPSGNACCVTCSAWPCCCSG